MRWDFTRESIRFWLDEPWAVVVVFVFVALAVSVVCPSLWPILLDVAVESIGS